MTPPLTLLPNTIVHQEEMVRGVTLSKLEEDRVQPKRPQSFIPVSSTQANIKEHPPTSVSLSFTFDSLTRTLNVIMTDKDSGEVVRKISYNSLTTGVHKAEKLNGLLLDQLA